MRATRARWAVALRIARRSALRSWGRSLLIVVLIAVPIAGLGAGALVLESKIPTQAEKVAYTLGRTQAVLMPVGARVKQDPLDSDNYIQVDSDGDATLPTVDPRSVLGARVRVLPVGTAAAAFRTAGGIGSLSVTTGSTADPSMAGRFDLVRGRAPRSAGEITVSAAALRRLAAHVGGTVHMVLPHDRTLRVVGVERDTWAASTDATVFGPTTTFAVQGSEATVDAYYVPAAPVSWAMVQRLNRVGVVVLSRAVLADPPRLRDPELLQARSRGASGSITLTVGLGALFAVFEIALLAGAAFAVGARQQQRMLATLASVGGDRSVLVRTVTGSGIVLGAAGGLVGLALGAAGGTLLLEAIATGSIVDEPGYHLPVLWWAAILLFAVLVGWLSALVPARAAARFDVLRALRGARTPAVPRRRTPVLGLGLLVVGIACTLGSGAALVAVKTDGTADLLLFTLIAGLGAGSLVAQVGAVLCSGLLLRGISRLLVRAPLGARLAARDTARNLGRTVPAVASVMTTVFVAVFAMCLVSAGSLSSVRSYSWGSNLGQVTSSVSEFGEEHPSHAAAARWVAAIRHDLPVQRIALLSTTRQGGDDETPSNRAKDALPTATRLSNDCDYRKAQTDDPTCGRFSGNQLYAPQLTVGSIADLRVVLGHAVGADAVRVLASGGAVAVQSGLLRDDRATIDWWTPKQLSDGAGQSGEGPTTPVRVQHLPAVQALPTYPARTSLFVTPATAERLGLKTDPTDVIVDPARPPTDRELDAATADLGGLANQPGQFELQVERGPQDLGALIAWAILAAVLVIAVSAGATAIGLARVDGRADDATLTAVGSTPGVRRAFSFVQGVIVCGVGAVIGAALGFVPALAVAFASSSLPFAPPWLQIVLTAIGIPVVIACGSWLLVGRHRPVVRRMTIA